MPTSNTINRVETAAANETDGRHFVYIASPLSTFRSPRYHRILARLGDGLPNSEFIIGRDRSEFDDAEDVERARWSAILRQCTMMCVIPDHEGWISQRIWEEMWDAVNHDLHVLVATADGWLTPLDRVTVREFHPGERRRFARFAFRDWPQRTGGV